MSSIFGKKTTQPKPKEPTDEEKKKIAEEKAKQESQAKALAEEKTKEEVKQKQLEKEKKEKEKKERERKEKERKELEEQQKQLEIQAMKSEIQQIIDTKMASLKSEIQTQIKQTQQDIVPNALDTQIKQITLEQTKLKTQLEVLDKIKELATPHNNRIVYYDRKTILIWIRKRYPQLTNLSDKELDTEEKIKQLPFYNKSGYDDQQILLFLATCIRRSGMIESHNLILAKMNEEGFKP